MSLSEIKAMARAALHGAMAEPCTVTLSGTTYPTPEQSDAGLSLTVRWHTKIRIQGERTSDDVGILEGVNRLVFQQPELDALGIVLRRGAKVLIPGYAKQFQLDQEEDTDGPLNVYWSVIEL